jgi:hypothetical protein
MQQPLASQIIRGALSVGGHLNRLSDLIDGLPNEADRKEFRKSLGEAMAMLYTDIMRPIIKEHPDLDPDK